MTRKFIPVKEAFDKWEKDPQFRAASDALEEEFSLTSALVEARGEREPKQLDPVTMSRVSPRLMLKLCRVNEYSQRPFGRQIANHGSCARQLGSAARIASAKHVSRLV